MKPARIAINQSTLPPEDIKSLRVLNASVIA